MDENSPDVALPSIGGQKRRALFLTIVSIALAGTAILTLATTPRLAVVLFPLFALVAVVAGWHARQAEKTGITIAGGMLAVHGGRVSTHFCLDELVTLVVTRRPGLLGFSAAALTLNSTVESLKIECIEDWTEALASIRAFEATRDRRMLELYRDDDIDVFLVTGHIASLVPDLSSILGGASDSTATETQPVLAMMLYPLITVLVVVGVVISTRMQNDRVSPVRNDAIYDHGRKRPHREIVQLMENQVLPFAKKALGPIVGGEEKVTCETCHGPHPKAHEWRMPAVAALPEPAVLRSAGDAVVMGGPMVQTALYGYLAAEGNEVKMKRMREVVLPGMARILRRPPYDFGRTYEYNASRMAFGCYHCHRIGPG